MRLSFDTWLEGNDLRCVNLGEIIHRQEIGSNKTLGLNMTYT